MQRARRVGRLLLLILLIAVTSVTTVALAQPAPAPSTKQLEPVPQAKPGVPLLDGATELYRFTTPAGLIDEAIAFDDKRVAYVVADAAAKAELHVVDIATKADQVYDASLITTQPTALAFVGARVLVIGKSPQGEQVAGLLDLNVKAKKPVVYKVPAATDIALITRDGKQRLAVHRVKSGTAGLIKHEAEILAVETGKRIGTTRALELDASGTNVKLNFKLNDWQDGFTRAHGIKSGEYDRREDQRLPDAEITYDVISGKFVDKQKIEDLFEQRRRFQAYAEGGGRASFVRFSWDNTGLHLWHAQKLTPVSLDQPLTNYDPKSLQAIVTKDGSGWIAIKVDATNAAAVARKKADPEYLDIFTVAPGSPAATRRARILSTKLRHRFGTVSPTKFWLLERNTGFERGGKSLSFYSLP